MPQYRSDIEAPLSRILSLNSKAREIRIVPKYEPWAFITSGVLLYAEAKRTGSCFTIYLGGTDAKLAKVKGKA